VIQQSKYHDVTTLCQQCFIVFDFFLELPAVFQTFLIFYLVFVKAAIYYVSSCGIYFMNTVNFVCFSAKVFHGIIVVSLTSALHLYSSAKTASRSGAMGEGF
jgi:hypothetical protein